MSAAYRVVHFAFFAAFLAVTSPPASAVKIDFDAPADGTVIDNYYFQPLVTSVTFQNPVGPGSVYARASTFNTSPGNVVSIFPTGAPVVNAFFGAVDATFNVVLLDQILTVTVKAAAVASNEPLGIPMNRPFMQVFDQFDVLLGTVYFSGALPSNPSEVTPFERLTYSIPPCVGTPIECDGYGIGKVRLSSQQGAGGPPIFALFDDLEWNPPSCGAAPIANGNGSSCAGTFYGDTCSTWTCDSGYVPNGSDPVCSSGAWTGTFNCSQLPAVPLLPHAGHWILAALLTVPGAILLGRERVRRRRI